MADRGFHTPFNNAVSNQSECLIRDSFARTQLYRSPAITPAKNLPLPMPCMVLWRKYERVKTLEGGEIFGIEEQFSIQTRNYSEYS
jgi:hypothetical protein